jgi:hypothetical protein
MNDKPKTVYIDGSCTVMEVVASIALQALPGSKQRFVPETIARITRSYHVSDYLGKVWDSLEKDDQNEIIIEADLAVMLAGTIPTRPRPH